MQTMRYSLKGILPFVFVFFAPVCVNAQAGGIDPEFSDDGFVTLEFGGSDVVQALALDEDGNIYAAGSAVPGAGPYKDIAVAKFTPNGAPDPIFGGDGSVTTEMGFGYDDQAYAIAIQPDGKILVGGSTNNGEAIEMCILRYRADGSLDPMFGDGGKLIIDFDGTDDAVRSLAILGDGSIIAGGYRMEMVTATMFKRNFAVVKCSSEGVLDASFGDGGKVATPFSSDRHASGFAMGVQTDGKIVMAGYSYVGTSANYQVALTRYNGDGTLDETFDDDGMVLVSTGFMLGEAYALQIQLDGKIVVGGIVYEGFDTDFAVMRFNTDGSLDPSFGASGLAQATWGTGEEEKAYGLALQWDGSIVIAGYKGNGSSRQTALLRFNSDGTPDASFGTDGRVGDDLSPEADGANAVLIQPDGKFLLGGYYDNGPDNDFCVMRYLSDPGTDIAEESVVPFTLLSNPVSDMLQVIVDAEGILSLYTLTGALVMEEQVAPGQFSYGMEDIAPGVYTLVFQTGGTRHAVQVVRR